MSASTRSVSPGARLLRSSRMFSMPAPIQPSKGDSWPGAPKGAQSATAAHPTHLAVTTTSASRATGDWGFKRPLPLKKTLKSTYPLVKIKQLDTIEEITDYQHAAAHTFSLRKFQEMNLPLTAPTHAAHQSAPAVSVFEEDDDVTDITWEKQMSEGNRRWKFQGPWLAGMADDEFERYLHTSVRGKRAEFHQFLRENLATLKTKEQERLATEERPDSAGPIKAQDIPEGQFQEYIKDLREDRFELYRLTGLFLDLAPVALGSRLQKLSTLAPFSEREIHNNPYSESGPPSTHPSAGLSYLRTKSYMDNHPLYGPQKQHAPVQARVLKPRAPKDGQFQPAIGVGGFVADKASTDTAFNMSKSATKYADKSLFQLDMETPGGAKLFVGAHRASIDNAGRAVIQIADVTNMTALVQKERMGEYSVYDDAMKLQLQATEATQQRRQIKRGARRIGSSVSYGIAPDQEPAQNQEKSPDAPQ